MNINLENFEECLAFLKGLRLNREQLQSLTEQQRIELLKVCGQLSRPSKDERKKTAQKIKKNQRKQQLIKNKMGRRLTGIRTAREANIFIAPKQISSLDFKSIIGEYTHPKECYVCRKKFIHIHHFYDSMCPPCGDLNYAKRYQTTDLSGQIALITGSRLKIGYHVTLQLLKAGATVIATTRFPIDSALRFSQEEDFNDWRDRLHIYGLDLRHTPSVELFALNIEKKYSRLDILINNAAQTVRRPSGFYTHLMNNERLGFHKLPTEAQKLLENHYQSLREIESSSYDHGNLPVSWHSKLPGIGLRASAELSQIPYSFDHHLEATQVFPDGKLDSDLQQVDLRTTNSWRLKLGEIPAVEMVEVQLVNAVAPFILCNRLIPMMKREHTGKKHIVNVSAMEGKFHRFKKEERHPHTNMAKAALNMMTHTAALDLAKYGIYMNAVDTGWVTDEDPVELAKKKQDIHDFQPPLDIVDGAARVCDPIIDGANTGKHWCGKFLKDYFPIDW